ncbi:MAG: type II toxin-antitoxin system PemK/MazF family toxin [Micrococcales bacterium]|nr:type II toxin-antitoxin system PemK/MazF family toxin [Micrococcales bacterium]
MIRGGVYQVNLGPVDEQGASSRGHEQRGRRYGILLSPSDSPLSVATIIPTSTRALPGVCHPVVDFDGRPTCALVEQARAIDVRFIGEMVGFLTRRHMDEVEHALANYLGLVP